MENLITVLQKAKDEFCTIEPFQIRKLLNVCLENQKHIKCDWDEWSGEEWLTLTIDKKKIAMLGVKIPIAFIIHNYYKSFELLENFKNIVINNFDESIWFINLEDFQLSFSELEWHASADAVDTNAFSTNDFWFATI